MSDAPRLNRRGASVVRAAAGAGGSTWRSGGRWSLHPRSGRPHDKASSKPCRGNSSGRDGHPETGRGPGAAPDVGPQPLRFCAVREIMEHSCLAVMPGAAFALDPGNTVALSLTTPSFSPIGCWAPDQEAPARDEATQRERLYRLGEPL